MSNDNIAAPVKYYLQDLTGQAKRRPSSAVACYGGWTKFTKSKTLSYYAEALTQRYQEDIFEAKLHQSRRLTRPWNFSFNF